MKCEEVQQLQGSHLDSELDARTTIDVEEHLKSCPECMRLFAEGQGLEARLKVALNQGPRTAALWERIEHQVATAASSASPAMPSLRAAQPNAWQTVWSALGEQLQAGWRRSRWAWAGLGAAWVAILVLHLSAQEPDARLVAREAVPSASDMRLALRQKQLLMAELAVTSEAAPAGKPKAASPGPRSQRPNQNPNA